MTARYVEGQGLILEIETGDTTLSSHSLRRIYYVPPAADGTPGDISTKAFVVGVPVAGEAGNSVNQGAAITLIAGVYRYWSESVNTAGQQCISNAFDVVVEKKGTVRR